jgi:hypothetical protein
MLERDVAMIDGIESRSRKHQPSALVAEPPARRVLAAVFDDEAAAARAAQALGNRLAGAVGDIGTAPLTVPALPGLSLTVVAGDVAGSAALQARRILAAFGGRIVADIEEIPVAAGNSAEIREEASDLGAADAQRPESG